MIRMLLSTGVVVVLVGMLITVLLIKESREAAVIPAEEVPMISFTIPEEQMDRLQIADIAASALSWDRERIRPFASTYAQIQWAALNRFVPEVFSEEFALTEKEQRMLLANSTRFLDPNYDFLGTVHAAGSYELRADATEAMVADLLVSRVAELDDPDTFIKTHLNRDAAEQAVAYVRGEYELLPDLVPLPPQDLVIEETKNSILLLFSTIYYNRGMGPLELRADPATMDIPGDIERAVFQRVYRENGTYHDRESGVFLWHQPHLHYHFADFVIYDLEAVDAPGAPELSGAQQKSTFCIRDVSRVSLSLENTPPDAGYKICGRERQGISVGWGDTYFYTYPDQNLNISGLPSGIYRLTFIVNPEDRFDEETKTNNTASALIELDMDALTVRVIETMPADVPIVEHIYEEQVLQ